MKITFKAALAGTLAAGLLAVTAGAAFATVPPYEPDSFTEHGTLSFYDASGNVITSGDATQLVPYFATNGLQTTAPFNGNATIVGQQPEPGVAPSAFLGSPLSATDAYPVAGAPAVLNNVATHPVLKSAAGEATFASLNTSNAHPASDNGTAYQGLYHITLLTNGSGGSDTQVWVADIVMTGTGCATGAAPCTWTQTYGAPSIPSISQVVTASPSSGTTASTFTITDTITPADVAGTVQFTSNGTNVGSPVTLTGVASNGTAVVSTTLPQGTDNLEAVFTPTDPTAFPSNTSTGGPNVTVSAAPNQSTSTGLVITPTNPQSLAPVTFTASVTPQTSGAPVGTVTFQEPAPTNTVIDTTPASAGSPTGMFTFVLSGGLSPGFYCFDAVFTPSAGQPYNGSTSAQVCITVTAAPFTAISTDIQNVTATVPAGTLIISTPYTPANPLNLGTLALNGTGTQFSATATFSSIVITDTRAAGAGGNFPITAKAQDSNLTNISGPGTINGENLGLTGLQTTYLPGNNINAGTNPVTTFDNPAANPAVGPSDPGAQGLGGGVAHNIATVAAGPGSFSMTGTVTLNAPSSTPAGTYNGTITFTAG